MARTGRYAPHALNSRRMQNEESPFFPRGAIAFFAAMMLFYAAFWLFVMSIMVSRG